MNYMKNCLLFILICNFTVHIVDSTEAATWLYQKTGVKYIKGFVKCEDLQASQPATPEERLKQTKAIGNRKKLFALGGNSVFLTGSAVCVYGAYATSWVTMISGGTLAAVAYLASSSVISRINALELSMHERFNTLDYGLQDIRDRLDGISKSLHGRLDQADVSAQGRYLDLRTLINTLQEELNTHKSLHAANIASTFALRWQNTQQHRSTIQRLSRLETSLSSVAEALQKNQGVTEASLRGIEKAIKKLHVVPKKRRNRRVCIVPHSQSMPTIMSSSSLVSSSSVIDSVDRMKRQVLLYAGIGN